MRILTRPSIAALAACVIASPASAADTWVKFEADNGEVIQLDTSRIQHFSPGSRDMLVLIYVGTVKQYGFDPERVRSIWLSCRGTYKDITGGLGPELDAPPRSVIGQIAQLACGSGD